MSEQAAPQAPQDTKTAPPNSAPAEKPADKPAEKSEKAEDYRARYEAAAEAAKAAQAAAAKVDREHKALLKSIEDGTLFQKAIAEKFGVKQDEDPTKVLERVKADGEKANAELARLRGKVRSSAIVEVIRAESRARRPDRIPAFISTDDLEFTDDGELTSDARGKLKDRLSKLRETDDYLFEPEGTENKDADRKPPLPSSAKPPPANDAPAEKPARRWGGLAGLSHLRRA